MNILIPDSWLREYLITDATPKDIQRCLSLCGPSIERMSKTNQDYVYDIEVTTNRVDCMSVYGIAREAVAILPEFGFKASLKLIKELKLNVGDIPNLDINNDFNLNHLVLALKLENVKIEPSPAWMQEKLAQIGLRPLNNLVDITNYVMWEVGHPCHVFDFHKLGSRLVFRQAKKNETLITLDNQKHTLLGGEVVISNNNNEIVDLPSIMGTANTIVSQNTTEALLFVDHVQSSKVRMASMSHAIRTNAAVLFEKEIDPGSAFLAMSRMVDLIKQLYPNIKIGLLKNIGTPPKEPKSITLSYSKIADLIGAKVPNAKIDSLLKRLNFQVKSNSKNISVVPPSYRSSDIQIPEDIVEEIARIYGYQNIPSTSLIGELPKLNDSSVFIFEQKIKTALKYMGFTEIYSYSLTATPAPLKISNPLSSEWIYMRDNLIHSHIEVFRQNRGLADQLYFFEIANVYLPKEEMRLIISSNTQNYPIIKGKIEALVSDLQISNIDIDIKIFENIYYWEIPIHILQSSTRPNKNYTPISKFMPLYEDFNFVLKSTYKSLETKIKNTSTLINQIELIDKYESKITLRITFHDSSRQLTNDDIAPIRQQINNLH